MEQENTNQPDDIQTTTETEVVDIHETQEAEAVEQETQSEQTQEQTEANTEANAEDHRNGFQKRIDRFNKKLAEREAEIEYWKKAALQQKPELAQPAQTQQNTGKPVLSDFDNIEDFTEAVTEYKIQQRELQAKKQTTITTYKQRAIEFAKQNPDYDDALEDTSHIPVQPEIHEVIIESEVGPQIAYHLAKNPAEIERLNALPAHRRLIELGKLEGALAAKKAPTNVPKATKAAPPVKAVSGAAPTKKDITDPSLSQAEYRAMRTAQLGKRR